MMRRLFEVGALSSSYYWLLADNIKKKDRTVLVAITPLPVLFSFLYINKSDPIWFMSVGLNSSMDGALRLVIAAIRV